MCCVHDGAVHHRRLHGAERRHPRERDIAFHTILTYYRFLLFGIINYTLPISVLVSTLVTFGILSKNNEVTAFKAHGVSLYRIALPVIGMAAAISVLAYL